MSQKTAKRIRHLEARVDAQERRLAAQEFRLSTWDAVSEAVYAQELLDTATARRAERRRACRAERAVSTWKSLAYAAFIAAIIVEIIAILAVRAAGVDAGPVSSPESTPAPAPVVEIEAEENENELIEAALLAQAQVIENCTVSHYDFCLTCCGKTDGITATGVRATPGVTVAVDPSVIPLGSDILVDYGDGEIHCYRADDVGGAVKGRHIDLCVESHKVANQLGIRTATVYWVAQETA